MIIYTDMPAGGAILFATSSIHLITVVQRRLGAQLPEHGANAISE